MPSAPRVELTVVAEFPERFFVENPAAAMAARIRRIDLGNTRIAPARIRLAHDTPYGLCVTLPVAPARMKAKG